VIGGYVGNGPLFYEVVVQSRVFIRRQICKSKVFIEMRTAKSAQLPQNQGAELRAFTKTKNGRVPRKVKLS